MSDKRRFRSEHCRQTLQSGMLLTFLLGRRFFGFFDAPRLHGCRSRTLGGFSSSMTIPPTR